MLNAMPSKLRDGSWGARVAGRVHVGQVVRVVTRAGKSWDAAVGRVIWSGDDNRTGKPVTLIATSTAPSEQRSHSGRERCLNCDERWATTTMRDSSGCAGPVCRICACDGSHGLSFG